MIHTDFTVTLTPEQVAELERVVTRCGVLAGKSRVSYQRTADVYQWGHADGSQLVFDIFKAWFDREIRPQLRPGE